MKLCVKKIYCPKCRKSVAAVEPTSDNPSRVLCSKCGFMVYVSNGIYWRRSHEGETARPSEAQAKPAARPPRPKAPAPRRAAPRPPASGSRGPEKPAPAANPRSQEKPPRPAAPAAG